MSNKYIAPLCFIAVIGNVQAAIVTKTTISQTSVTPKTATAGTMFKFTATLNAPLAAGNKVKIDLGKGLASMTGTKTSYSLSRAIFTTGLQTYKVGIYNAKNVLQGGAKKSIYRVTSALPPEPVAAEYTKICNSGALEGEEDCPINPVLGNQLTDWACTKDNTTGLIWEVKTTDGGLRDSKSLYSWYEPAASKNGGYSGIQSSGSCNGSECDTYAFKNAVNQQSLCGANDWRLPTNEELKGLVYCSDGKYQKLAVGEDGQICTGSPTSPAINTNYFLDTTDSEWFWSSFTHADYSGNAWVVVFNTSWLQVSAADKKSSRLVRLVR